MDGLSHTNWADEVEEEEEEQALEQQAAQNAAHIEVQNGISLQPVSKPKPSSAQPYVPPAQRSGRDTPPHVHALPRDGRMWHNEGAPAPSADVRAGHETSRQGHGPGPAPAVSPAKPSVRQSGGAGHQGSDEQASHAELLQQMRSMLHEHEEYVMAKVHSKLSTWQDELTQRVTQSVLQQVMMQLQPQPQPPALQQAAPAAEKQAVSITHDQQEPPSAAEPAADASQPKDRVSVFDRLGAARAAAAPQDNARCSSVSDANTGDSRDEEADAYDSRMKNRPSRATRAGFTVYTPPSRHAPGSNRMEEAGEVMRHQQYDHHVSSNSKPHPYDRAVGNGQSQGPERSSRHVTR